LDRVPNAKPASTFAERDPGWRFETRAGGGITADSDPAEEDAEAEAKIAAIRLALTA
jgi:para-aminobenzoate synthetase component 1